MFVRKLDINDPKGKLSATASQGSSVRVEKSKGGERVRKTGKKRVGGRYGKKIRDRYDELDKKRNGI